MRMPQVCEQHVECKSESFYTEYFQRCQLPSKEPECYSGYESEYNESSEEIKKTFNGVSAENGEWSQCGSAVMNTMEPPQEFIFMHNSVQEESAYVVEGEQYEAEADGDNYPWHSSYHEIAHV